MAKLILSDSQREVVLDYCNIHRQALFGTLNNGGVTTGTRGEAGKELVQHCLQQGTNFLLSPT